MNARQKAGIGLSISGVVTLVIGIFALTTQNTPDAVQIICNVLSTALPLVGLAVNLPSNTNPR